MGRTTISWTRCAPCWTVTRREAALRLLVERPAQFGRLLGFKKLTGLHDDWIRRMLWGREDMTLQAHRGAYKTTAVGVALTIQLMLRGDENCMFIRKTDDDVKEVIRQVARNLESPTARAIYRALTGRTLTVRATQTAITTGAYRGVSGAAQLLGIGTQSSITGRHADRIFTDDIVNLQDRASRAERERVKDFYHELQNVRNRGGRIVNTGTPWHREDAFSCMPEPLKFDCYATGLMDAAMIDGLRQSMPPSLFAANYELRHIASEDALFTRPPAFTDDESLLHHGVAHIDAAYGGEDYTALTCGRRVGDRLYLYGRLWRGHVDRVLDQALSECERLMCAPVHTETNGDKGYLAREIARRGYRAGTYCERENKYVKISTYLRKWWPEIVWLRGTDPDYIAQIMDYTTDAEHDDAPDSAACVCRYYDHMNGTKGVNRDGSC